jgi:acetylglutamate kinase
VKIVVKVGGELLAEKSSAELAAITADLAKLIAGGDRVVLVHGGGPQTTALQEALGQTPNIIGGRRVTDQAALDALLMVVGGKLNVAFVGALRRAGIKALGLHGVSGGLIEAVRRPPKPVSGGDGKPVDFGFVGDITGINAPLLDLLLDAGYSPVVACIGGDAEGRAYNINADMVANGLAQGIGAERLLLITNTPGVLADVQDPSSRIKKLSIADGRAAIANGSVKGGMIPKLEESFEVLERGIEQVHILGKLGPGDLFKAMAEPGSIGTALVR